MADGLVAIAQKLAAVGANLNSNNEHAGKVHQQAHDLIEPMAVKIDVLNQIEADLHSAAAANDEHELGKEEQIAACIEKVQELIGFITAAHAKAEEVEQAAEELKNDITEAERVVDEALTALN